MYLEHFGLARQPFLISPDPGFLYPSSGHREALAHLEYGLQREGGFILLTGEVGTGKTTLCRLLIGQLPEHCRLAYILNARLDGAGVLAALCRELEIETDAGESLDRRVERLHDDLLAAHADNRQTLVVIEEAQNLGAEALETLRLLTNLETDTNKLLHILLIGQPELLDHLARPALRQLNQRVVSRFHLGPLTRRDVRHYLDYRVRRAGGEPPLFTRGAVAQIARRTGGIPRLINLLAEQALVGAFAEGRKRVTATVVRRAAPEVFGRPGAVAGAPGRWRFATVAGFVLMIAGTAWLASGRLSLDGGTEPGTVIPVTASERPIREVPAVSPDRPADAAPSETVFTRWLGDWAPGMQVRSVTAACEAAAERNLSCETLTGLSAEDMRAIDRPLLVTLGDGGEGLDYYVVSALGSEGFQLVNSRDRLELTAAELSARWNGTARLLWRPPPGFAEPLWPGQHNPALVDYLVGQLRAGGYLEEALITGGTYSEYLAQQVRRFQRDRGLAVDGILGLRTLLHLNALSRDVPTLAGSGGA